MARIPLIEDLITGPIPAGSNLLVEYDPASQWCNASITITAGWLKTGGRARYDTFAQPPDDVRAKLRRLGLELGQLERRILDSELPSLVPSRNLSSLIGTR